MENKYFYLTTLLLLLKYFLHIFNAICQFYMKLYPLSILGNIKIILPGIADVHRDLVKT
jgi:hypothetical protein